MTQDWLIQLGASGTVCYVLGLFTGARIIPWLVDRGLFPATLSALTVTAEPGGGAGT
jgi:hypothetical protein